MASNYLGKGHLRSAFGGVLAYVISFVIIYQLSVQEVQELLGGEAASSFASGAPVWKVMGWIFYNAHYAPTSISGGEFLGSSGSVNIIPEVVYLGPELYVIPPALMLAVGYFAARMHDPEDVGDAVSYGPAIALGYLPFAIAGTFLFKYAADGATAQPDIVLSIGYAGLVYPLVFGTIGALMAAR